MSELIRRGLYFLFTPKELRLLAQRLLALRATLGHGTTYPIYPEGVVSVEMSQTTERIKFGCPKRFHNPFRVKQEQRLDNPRVASIRSQPWARLHNSFGVRSSQRGLNTSVRNTTPRPKSPTRKPESKCISNSGSMSIKSNPASKPSKLQRLRFTAPTQQTGAVQLNTSGRNE